MRWNPLITAVSVSVVLGACNSAIIAVPNGSLPIKPGQTSPSGSTADTPPSPSAAPSSSGATNAGLFIRSKKMSNLSNDRSTITLSVDATDPANGALSMTWEDTSKLGDLNSTAGSTVQWAAKAGQTGTGIIKVTITNGQKTEVAELRVPVSDGKIKPAELTPEVSVAPQSAILFRPLPTSLGLSEDQLFALGVKTKVTLAATTFKFNPVTNVKEKTPYDAAETRWQTADADLAIVSENGTVRPADGSKVGSTTITALSKTDSSQSATASIKVQYLSTKIDLSFDKTTVTPGGTMKLGASVAYSNPDDRGRVIYTDTSGRELSWSSSDKTKAQVDTQGNVRVLADAAAGEVTITASSNYDPSVSEAVKLKITTGQ